MEIDVVTLSPGGAVLMEIDVVTLSAGGRSADGD
jgi:hypothetical protein